MWCGLKEEGGNKGAALDDVFVAWPAAMRLLEHRGGGPPAAKITSAQGPLAVKEVVQDLDVP